MLWCSIAELLLVSPKGCSFAIEIKFNFLTQLIFKL